MAQDPKDRPLSQQPRAWRAQLVLNVLLMVGGFGAGQLVDVVGKTGVFEPEDAPPQIVRTDCQTIVHKGAQVGAIVTVELDRIGTCAVQREGYRGWLWEENSNVRANQFQYLLLPEDSGMQEAPPAWCKRIWVCTHMLTNRDRINIQEVELK